MIGAYSPVRMLWDAVLTLLDVQIVVALLAVVLGSGLGDHRLTLLFEFLLIAFGKVLGGDIEGLHRAAAEERVLIVQE